MNIKKDAHAMAQKIMGQHLKPLGAFEDAQATTANSGEADYYKIKQLEKMLTAEKDPEHGGYGAHLTHWFGTASPIQLDAEAIRALIRHYEIRAGLRTKRGTTQRCDLENAIAKMGIYEALNYMRSLGFDLTEPTDENANTVYYESYDGMEYAFWRREV